MKLAYSTPDTFRFPTYVGKDVDGIITVRWGSPDNAPVELSEEFIKSYVGKKELSEATNLYILIDGNGVFHSIRPKMVESFLSKKSGFDYSKQQKLFIAGQIYISFSDTQYDEWVLRLNFNPEQEIPAYFQEGTFVGSQLEDFHAFTYSTFPSIKVVGVDKTDNGSRIKVQLTKAGQDVSKSGVRVFAKASSGYLAKTESYTDESGQASFTAIRLGLEASEDMTVEFGFKWLSNVTRQQVAA